MADVDINKFRASVVREGSKPASPGFIVSEGQSPTDPAGSGQNHLPVTIAEAATGLSITDSQVLGGAGTVGQYIRGDGSLADFPESSGGGSSVSYYLNGSVSQGTIGGVAYKELNKVPILGAGTDFTIAADGYIASFLTDAGDPNLLEIPAGNWTFETYFSASSGGGSPTFYVELYKYDGTTFTLIASNSTFPELIAFGTNIISYFSTLAVPTTALALTDRLAIRYYVTHSGRTITLHTEDNHLCQIITTFTTGLTALNGLTAQIQNFAVGTSGTDFAIASATATHTFNLPTASATNRGALSSADWTTFNGKQNALTNPVTGTGTSGQVAYFTGTNTITSESGLLWDASNNILGINTITPDSNSKLDVNGQAFVARLAVYNNNGTPTLGTSPMFYSPASGTLGISTNTSLRMLISDTGNVQIGSVTPTNSRLLVSGTHVTSHGILGVVPVGNNTATIALYNSSVVRKGLFFADTGFVRLDTDGDPLQLYSNGNIGLQVFANGNLFVGSSPTDNGARLQVSGTGTFTGQVISNDDIRSLQTTTSGNAQIIADSNNGTTLRAGMITFGSTASDSLLGILRASNSMLYKDGGKLAIGTRNSFDLVLSTSDTARLTISSTGAATFSSSLSAGGKITISGVTNNNFQSNRSGTSAHFQTWYEADGTTRRGYFGYGEGGTNNFSLMNEQSGTFVIGTNSINAITLSSTGAATFAGDVTISKTSPTFRLTRGSTSASSLLVYNTNGTDNWLVGTGVTGTNTNYRIYNNSLGADAIFIVNSNNNVLIGSTTDNGAKFQVTGTLTTTGDISLMNASGDIHIRMKDSGGNADRVLLRQSGSNDIYVGDIDANGGRVIIRTNGNDSFILSASGSAFFSSLGTGTVTATSGTLSTTSDMNLKIEDGFIDSAIDKVVSLKPRYFYWNEKSGLPTDIRQLGFYAQEVNEALGEEAANKPKDLNTPWGISDRSIIAYLTKAIQELKQEIDTLKN